MIVRKATSSDFEAMRAIYNHAIHEEICSNFDNEPASSEEWIEHMDVYNKEGDNHPMLVIEDDGVVCGYAGLSPFRAKDGYAPTVELSIYVSEDRRGKGLGNILMESILNEARQNEKTHAVVSVIADGNEASHALHTKHGFTYCGTLRDVAFKTGSFRNADYYQLIV